MNRNLADSSLSWSVSNEGKNSNKAMKFPQMLFKELLKRFISRTSRDQI